METVRERERRGTTSARLTKVRRGKQTFKDLSYAALNSIREWKELMELIHKAYPRQDHTLAILILLIRGGRSTYPVLE